MASTTSKTRTETTQSASSPTKPSAVIATDPGSPTQTNAEPRTIPTTESAPTNFTIPAAPPTEQVPAAGKIPSEVKDEKPTQAHAQVVQSPPNPAEIYEQGKAKFSQEGLPTNQAEWLKRASEVAQTFAIDVVEREKANKSPRAEIDFLKASGLLKVLGRKKYGGGEEPWSTGFKVIREVAKGDR